VALQAVSLVFSATYEIADGVYSFTSATGYVSMFIVTGEGVMVIEPVSSQHSTEMVQAISDITDEPIKYLFYSHNHWDHASGGQVFKDLGATIISHEYAYQYIEANPGPDQILPDEVWSGRQNDVTVGGVTLELYYFGGSHGVGMTAFLLPVAKVAYIADNVSPNRVGMATLPDFDIKQWERTLGEYLKLDFEKAVFTHNNYPEPLKGGDKEDVVQMISFLKDIRDGIYAELDKGTNPGLIPTTLKLPQYEHWDMYEEWLPMNIWAIFLQEPISMGPFMTGPRHEDPQL
jgi:glyoxylase-like metal-dependent hydrolase (beta-lactamase superfamily II)